MPIEDASSSPFADILAAKRAKLAEELLDESEGQRELNPMERAVSDPSIAQSAASNGFNTYLPISILFIGNLNWDEIFF